MSFVSKSKTRFAPKIKRRVQPNPGLSANSDTEQKKDKVGTSQINDKVGTSQINDKVGTSQINDKVGPSQINDKVGTSQINDKLGPSQINGKLQTSQINDNFNSSQTKENLNTLQNQGENDVASNSSALPTVSKEPETSISENIDTNGKSVSPIIESKDNTPKDNKSTHIGSKPISSLPITSNNKTSLPSKRRLSSITTNSSRRVSVKLEDKYMSLKNGVEQSNSTENSSNDLLKKLKKKKKKKSSSSSSVVLSVPKFRSSFSDENRHNESRSNSNIRYPTNSNLSTSISRRNSNISVTPPTNEPGNEVITAAEKEFDKAFEADLIYESIPSLIYKKRKQDKKKEIQKEMGLDENDKKFLGTNEQEIDFNKICLVLDPRTKQVRALKKVYHEIFKKKYPNMEFKITSYSQLPRHGVSLDEQLFKDFSIDENNFSMSDLCVPSLPIGEVSQDYKLAKEGTKKLRLARLHQMKMRKEARQLGIPLDDLLNTGESLEEIQRRKEKVEELFSSHEDISAATSALQLNLHGGEIVVDQDSQLVDTRQNLNFSGRERTIENENPYENPIHSRSFSKYSYSDRWSLEETVRLYHALGTWGTDFGIISGLFPHRTRRQIKKKFTLEEKKRLPLVEMALNKKLPPNLESYIQGFNSKKDSSEKVNFKTVEEFNEELDAEREKHKKELEAIKKEIEKSKENDREMTGKKKEEDNDSNEEVIGEIPLRGN